MKDSFRNLRWDTNAVIDNLNTLYNNYKNGKYNDKYQIIDGICMSLLMLDFIDEKELLRKTDEKKIMEINYDMHEVDMINLEDSNGYSLDIDSEQMELLNIVAATQINNKYLSCEASDYIDFDKQQFIEIILNFLWEFNLEIYYIFIEGIYDKTISIVDKSEWKQNYIGQFFMINELKKAYMIVPYDNHLNYLSGIVHEVAHMYSTVSRNYEPIEDDWWDYVEVISLTLELIFKDYLMRSNIISKEVYISNTVDTINYAAYRAQKICDCNKIIDKCLIDNDFSEDYIKELKEYPAGHETLYVTNLLIAISLFNEYKKDYRNGSILISKLSKMNKKENLNQFNMELSNDVLINNYNEFLTHISDQISLKKQDI